MSESADDLLIYGVAAAKANSRDEARYYLEWVLRTDADLDQQAEAWYWLSTITDDKAEKRSCLENVLAILPRHPEARRDLAIVDGKVDPTQIPDPRYDVQPVTPRSQLEAGDLQQYKCPRCGARLTADRVTAALSCSFCGYRPAAAGQQADTGTGVSPPAVADQDWVTAIYSTRGRRWEIPTARTFRCTSCGASVLVPPGQVSMSCPFCGTPQVVQAAEERDLIQPAGVLPFSLSEGAAFSAIAAWLKREHFVPEDLSRRSVQILPHPIYLPFWTFDMEGDIRWSGYETTVVYGKPRAVPTSGSTSMLFDDVQVAASKSVDNEILDRLHYDLQKLIAYSADQLSNWPAEIYSISPVEASLAAREKALHGNQTSSWLKASAGAAVEDLLVVGVDLSILSYKLALLPAWIGSYTYEDHTYNVVVNGSSGEVEGNVPRNLVQRMLNHLLG